MSGGLGGIAVSVGHGIVAHLFGGLAVPLFLLLNQIRHGTAAHFYRPAGGIVRQDILRNAVVGHRRQVFRRPGGRKGVLLLGQLTPVQGAVVIIVSVHVCHLRLLDLVRRCRDIGHSHHLGTGQVDDLDHVAHADGNFSRAGGQGSAAVAAGCLVVGCPGSGVYLVGVGRAGVACADGGDGGALGAALCQGGGQTARCIYILDCLGAQHLVGINHAAVDPACADVLAVLQILQLDRNGKFLDPGRKPGMPGDKHQPGGVIVEFVDGKSSDLAHSAGLLDLISQTGSPHKMILVLQQHGIKVRRGKQISALSRYVGLAHCPPHVHDQVVGAGCIHAGCVVCSSLCQQHGCAVGINSFGEGIACTVQPIRHQIGRYGFGVIAVNDFSHSLVLVDGQGLVCCSTVGCSDAVCLVVIRHLHLRIPYRDLDGSGAGLALVVVVENYAVLQHQAVPQLGKDEIRVAFLLFVCHIDSSLVSRRKAGVLGVKCCLHAVGSRFMVHGGCHHTGFRLGIQECARVALPELADDIVATDELARIMITSLLPLERLPFERLSRPNSAIVV